MSRKPTAHKAPLPGGLAGRVLHWMPAHGSRWLARGVDRHEEGASSVHPREREYAGAAQRDLRAGPVAACTARPAGRRRAYACAGMTRQQKPGVLLRYPDVLHPQQGQHEGAFELAWSAASPGLPARRHLARRWAAPHPVRGCRGHQDGCHCATYTSAVAPAAIPPCAATRRGTRARVRALGSMRGTPTQPPRNRRTRQSRVFGRPPQTSARPPQQTAAQAISKGCRLPPQTAAGRFHARSET
jgi:hypothetical protein